MRFCPSCAEENSENATFCKNCGVPLGKPVEMEAPIQPVYREEKPLSPPEEKPLSPQQRYYTYKMIQLPPTIIIQKATEKGQEAAIYLENIVNQHAINGWEFFRVDTIGVITQPGCGCLGALLGMKDEHFEYYVVTFRRQIE